MATKAATTPNLERTEAPIVPVAKNDEMAALPEQSKGSVYIGLRPNLSIKDGMTSMAGMVKNVGEMNAM